jgi:hypothetical protein
VTKQNGICTSTKRRPHDPSLDAGASLHE